MSRYLKISVHEPFLELKREQREATPRLLLLHGYGQSRVELLPLGYMLAEAGFQVSIPDLPGHGAQTEPLTASSVTDFVHTCFTQVGPKASVIGFSLGARLAMTLPADRVVAVSPPLPAKFVGETRDELLRVLRPRWVVENKPMEGLTQTLQLLGAGLPKAREMLLVYAQKDLGCVKEGIDRWKDLSIVRTPPLMIPDTDHLSILASRLLAGPIVQWLKE